MFEDSELPDFDSMTQEELIEWLEQLAKSHSAATSEFIDDHEGEHAATDADNDTEEDDWSDWLDDTVPGVAASAGTNFVADGGAGQDPPVDLSLFDEEDTAATASLDWLDEITAAQNAAVVPDFNDFQSEPPPAENLHDLPGGDAGDDPLDWLNHLDSNGVSAASSEHDASELEVPDDFDETWEDDEELDDLEDESLYSPSLDAPTSFLESLLGLEDREAEKHSTQSMAPVPDSQAADKSEGTKKAPLVPAGRADSLTRAFLIQEREADLEAWYADRLREITAPAKVVAKPPVKKPEAKPAKPPPPGLAAAINSARGKVKRDDLMDALLDYETLLGTTAGLQWVVHDMRALVVQNKYRSHPSVYRVLGDALMRQGHLNAALSVYRHALSLL